MPQHACRWMALTSWMSVVVAVGAGAGATDVVALLAVGLLPPCALWSTWMPRMQAISPRTHGATW